MVELRLSRLRGLYDRRVEQWRRLAQRLHEHDEITDGNWVSMDYDISSIADHQGTVFVPGDTRWSRARMYIPCPVGISTM